jgi:hypothetical protein
MKGLVVEHTLTNIQCYQGHLSINKLVYVVFSLLFSSTIEYLDNFEDFVVLLGLSLIFSMALFQYVLEVYLKDSHFLVFFHVLEYDYFLHQKEGPCILE